MFGVLSIALKRKKYLAIALSSSLLVAAASFYFMTLPVSGRSIEIYAEMNGAAYTFASVLLGLVSSLLFGFYLSLLILRKDLGCSIKSKVEKPASLIGISANIFASGCPTCGAPVLALLGLPFALGSLPFQGNEMKFISIIFMALSIYYLCKNIEKNVACNRSADALEAV